MEAPELLEIINRGEDSFHQFKSIMTNQNSLAAEMVAFSNAPKGGKVIIGVTDTGQVLGMSPEDISTLNQLVSNTASEWIRPAINPQTENVQLPHGLVVVITIPEGISKPYMDKNGVVWVKNGADKRRATSREELQRLFQRAGLIHGDEIPANGMTVADLDIAYFRSFLSRQYSVSLEQQGVSLPQLLENMNLAKNAELNIASALIFAERPQFRLPAFIVKAIRYPADTIDQDTYIESQDIVGKLADVFQQSLGFVLRNIRYTQGDQMINSKGIPEVPRIVLEELLANALIHRDYFISAPVKIFIFSNRIEIISPGHLPNNLTIENIKNGNSNMRNPILASFATKILPYSGLGTGISRSLKAYPHIQFEDDREGNLFKVKILLPSGY